MAEREDNYRNITNILNQIITYCRDHYRYHVGIFVPFLISISSLGNSIEDIIECYDLNDKVKRINHLDYCKFEFIDSKSTIDVLHAKENQRGKKFDFVIIDSRISYDRKMVCYGTHLPRKDFNDDDGSYNEDCRTPHPISCLELEF